MDIDENPPLRRGDPLAILIKQDIDALSVTELEARIAALRSEITRCEGKVAFASKHRSVADALFKK
ncbi:MAG: hypothetical protein B7Y44_01055 [Sphingomonadales bacterium 28-55-16]|nr:MAG: hypothetical protein B7Y44_01055 [Sphingomonadales bacterium 28-55-16]